MLVISVDSWSVFPKILDFDFAPYSPYCELVKKNSVLILLLCFFPLFIFKNKKKTESG